MSASAEHIPKTDFRGLREHWRSDLIAGSSVALVALPLALGIATAAGAPAISGLVSAVVAGLLATFLRGSKVAINGPGNSLIVIVAGGLATFSEGPGLGLAEAFPHLLGAVVVAGGMQILLGVFRLGKFGDLIPASVVQGVLAAIGVIIVGKQAHVLFGQHGTPGGPVDLLLQLPQTITQLHPASAFIGLLSLGILMIHPKIKAKAVHFIPATLWVVILTLPIGLTLDHFAPEIRAGLPTLASGLALPRELMVSIPDDILGSLVHPNFSRIGEPTFWGVVLTLTLVTSMENVVSVKAVDKLDPYRRRSDLNRDLIAMGLSTACSGMLGGLPVLTVVARSSVNVNHGAQTGWSNFFSGVVLAGFVLFLGPLIEEITLSALAGILVYTGYKLTAPHVVEETLRKGPDHFLVFGATLVATLVWGLLWGLLLGLCAELTSHGLILGVRPLDAFRLLRETRVETEHEKTAHGDPGPYVLKIRGLANYFHILKVRAAFEAVPPGEKLILDFSAALLVDNTLLEQCHDLGRRYARAPGSSFDMIGLEAHHATSDHPDALHSKERSKRAMRLTPRQQRIATYAEKRDWSFDGRRDWAPDHLEDFHFFRLHPIEYQDTVVRGAHRVEQQGGTTDVEFTLSDVTFDEGALIPEVYHTTTLVFWLPFELPELVLEKTGVFDRALKLAGFEEIGFRQFTDFSKKFLLRGANEGAVRGLITPELLKFLEGEEIYHLEIAGDELVLFQASTRLSTAGEIERMLDFSERLLPLLMGSASDDDEEGALNLDS